MAPGRDQLKKENGEPGDTPAVPGARTVKHYPSRIFWRASVALVFALAGGLFWTARDTAAGAGDIRQDRPSRLSDLILSQNNHNKDFTGQISAVRNDVDALTRGQSSDSRVRAAQAQVDALAGPAGLTPVTGSTITVTLNDAPANFQPVVSAPAPQPDWLIIHQQDVQAVVNALWNGGATAIQLMDQRIVATSAVRCVGNTLLLQGRVYSPPYVVTAVGDPSRLRGALAASPTVQTYLEYVSAYGLGYDVQEGYRVTLPGYSGLIDVSHTTIVP